MTPGEVQPRTCDFCGLPLTPGSRDALEHPQERLPAYCCVGCSIASSVTGAQGAEGHSRWMLVRLGLGIFFTMNVMVCTLVLWSQDVYTTSGEHAELATALWGVFRYAGMLFSLPVLFLLGGPILDNVLQSARRGVITTDWLILLGVVSAYLYSAVTTFRGEGHVYFELACVVLVMVTLGRWLEAVGKLKTGEALDGLTRLLPEMVRRLVGDQSEEVARESVQRGDLLRVLPGERFAVDGQLVRGEAAVDEQILSGESVAVSKGMGDAVFSGTLNVDGDLTLEVTAPVGEETVSRLVELVRQSRQAAGTYQRHADRVASWFVPAVAVMAIAVAAWHGATGGFEQGVLAGLAIVLIACPCALGLATPMAIWTAMGHAARRQVLFQSAEALERLAIVSAIRLDKTGTLTSGDASVEEIAVDSTTSRKRLLEVTRVITAGSNHTLSSAIGAHIGRTIEPPESDPDARNASVPSVRVADGSERGHPPLGPSVVRTIAGRGLVAENVISGESAYLGNRRHMDDFAQLLDRRIETASDAAVTRGKSIVLVGWEGRARGLFVLGERLRPEALQAVKALREQGLDIGVLTGDHPLRAEQIATAVGVPVSAEQLPEDKVAAIEAARREHGVVAMVGDGINDAPALAAADVGVAMGCGADLSRDAGDVCLLTNNLLRLPWVIDFSRRVVKTIRQNLFWAFAYNVVGIGIAATGRLNPILAAAAMMLSSLFVVTNSLRLGRDEMEPGTPVPSTPAAGS